MVAGPPHQDLRKGMENEHLAMAGHDEEFETDNYGLRTTPADEFNIATGRMTCQEKNLLDRHGRRVRIIRRIEELKTLKLVEKAELTDDEILAVVGSRPDPRDASRDARLEGGDRISGAARV
jgi:hypothetical protein